jgi:uncharacterized phage infection (PIP) family protein YhgE
MTAANLTHRITQVPATGLATSKGDPTMSAQILTPFPVSVPTETSLEDRLDVVTHLLDELAEGVNALLTEAPRTARRIDEVESKVDGLVAGLSELLSATQAIAAKLDASATDADQ